MKQYKIRVFSKQTQKMIYKQSNKKHACKRAIEHMHFHTNQMLRTNNI